MRRTFAVLVLGGLALFARASSVSAQTIFTVETPHDGTSSTLVAHTIAATDSTRTIARIAHHEDTPPLATVSHDGAEVALLNIGARGEPRRHSDLVVIDAATGQQRTLATELQQVPAMFSRDDRTIFVVRSSAAPPPSDDETRRGHLENERLSVLAIDRATASTSIIADDVAYMLHPAGVSRTGELIFIRASWDGGSVVALDPATGRFRTLIASRENAFRDATLDGAGESVVVLERVGRNARVLRIQIEDGSVTVVDANAHTAASPVAANRTVLLGDAARTLALVSGSTHTALWSVPEGAMIRAVAVSASASLIAFETTSPTSRETLALSTASGVCLPLAVPNNVVVHVAGIIDRGAR